MMVGRWVMGPNARDGTLEAGHRIYQEKLSAENSPEICLRIKQGACAVIVFLILCLWYPFLCNTANKLYRPCLLNTSVLVPEPSENS